jgi:xanthine/CO dehydrogenase XdhC/CoxF family maturation factor
MSILLTRVAAANDWQPLAHLSAELAAHRETAVGLVVESENTARPAGSVIIPGNERREDAAIRSSLINAASSLQVGWVDSGEVGTKVFALPLALPPRVLLLGAGPDTVPIVDFATRLGWKVTLIDHRSAYAQAAHFPAAERVVHARPDEFASMVDLTRYVAAVVMSHHLPSDLAYLQVLASSDVPYVGLLGPAIRREKLLTDLGTAANRLRPRLRAPVGLALGGRAPESIALAIVSEIHAFVHDARGRPSSETAT